MLISLSKLDRLSLLKIGQSLDEGQSRFLSSCSLGGAPAKLNTIQLLERSLVRYPKALHPWPPSNSSICDRPILSDMNTEITTLEQRCNQTRDLKQAMMQALLTERIRLKIEA
jgi:hypothetical protein